jgi:uncharacterized Zn finger protein
VKTFEDGFPGPPRKVVGGIKARSARGAIGDTWWSRRFIASLETLADKGRLGRGRAYARKGQVMELTIEPGVVRSRVQGSRPDPYRVSIAFAAVAPPVWEGVERRLAERARYAAHLLAGQVPHELIEVFEEEGAHLFPVRPLDLNLECSCPDWGWPCKHVAATCYLLAEAFDDDPFALLRWRGRDRETLLGNVRTHRDGKPARKRVVREREEPTVGTAAALAPAIAVTPTELIGRWWVEPVPLPDQPPAGASDVAMVRQLPAPPASVGGQETADALAEIYSSIRNDAMGPSTTSGRS